MPGLVPGIHVLAVFCLRKTWMAGHRRAEATPSFKSILIFRNSQAPKTKIFRFTFLEIRIISMPSRAHMRDASRSSRNVGRLMRWTLRCQALFALDDDAAAYGEVVWSWRRDAGVKLLRSKLLRGDGGKKARSPGRARSKP